MGYIVRDRDQWGAIHCKVEGDQIWLGEYISGLADMTITPDPHSADRKLVRRGHLQGEVLYCIVQDPYGEGYYVRERDVYGRKLYFVEASRHDGDALLVREGDQHGSVAFYVEESRWDGAHGGALPREKTWVDKAMARGYDLLLQAFRAPKRRFGKSGVIIAMMGWFAFLLLIGLLARVLGLLGWYAIPFGLLVVWEMFQIIHLYT